VSRLPTINELKTVFFIIASTSLGGDSGVIC